MLVRAISDLHGFLFDIEPCDLLLIAGDICPVRDHSLDAQAKFLDGDFRRWLDRVPAKHVVGVCGNHDFIFERDPGRVPRDLRWTYLQDSSAMVEGLKVYGTPWQPWFYDWAFNLYEPDLVPKWEMIDGDADILVFHGPPAGYGDLTIDGNRTGSPSQLARIRKIGPKLVVFGHIHEGRGQWTIPNDRGGETILANVSSVNVRYRRVHEPMAFEVTK